MSGPCSSNVAVSIDGRRIRRSAIGDVVRPRQPEHRRAILRPMASTVAGHLARVVVFVAGLVLVFALVVIGFWLHEYLTDPPVPT